VAPLGEPRRFEGLVTDQDGSTLEGAVVLVSQDPKHVEDQSVPSIGAHRATTDANGRFSIPNLFAPKIHVAASKAGYATKVERDVPVVAAASGRIVLERTTPVRVTVVDTSGAPVEPPLDVTGIFQGIYKSRGRADQPGVYAFDGIGPGSFEVRVARANGTWSKTLDTAAQRDVRIMIPALGVARLTWEKALVAGSEKHLVTLTTAGVEGNQLSRFVKSGETEVKFDAVVPGVYTATIEVDPRTLKEPAGRKPLAEARVEIVEGQTAEVVFKRP
jgi:Carboxypeptidase regulatory-like domain